MRGGQRSGAVRCPPAAPRLSAAAAAPPADARVAAWPRPRRFNLPALGERKLRRGAPHLSLHTGGGRRDRDAARITGRARCGRRDAARTYCCRCGGGKLGSASCREEGVITCSTPGCPEHLKAQKTKKLDSVV